MIIKMDLGKSGYDIVVQRGCLDSVEGLLNLDRKVLVVTDDGVPCEYSKKIASKCKTAVVQVVEQGEKSKSFDTYKKLIKTLTDNNFTRGDCVVAVGGGVVGDLSGFVASTYMRGIDFYNVPTTLLSQIDSSIGGKVAINMEGIKNIVGAFYQPKKVIIDPDVLSTLPPRQISHGLAEAIKMSLTSDKELFELFENADILENIDTIIEKSLMIKRDVVQKDEKESGLRKILNFGHTIGHGIESKNSDGLFHGECVALGMIPMCAPNIRERVIKVLEKVNLPTKVKIDLNAVCEAISHDKKGDGDAVTGIFAQEVGTFEMKKIKFDELYDIVHKAFED